MMRLVDKVAVVTGSTNGIGYEIAKRLAQEGAKVVVSSRKQDNVDRAVEDLRKEKLDVIGVKCHVGETADRTRLFEETIKKYGKLNILVSNAGVNPAVMPTLECDENAFQKTFDINTKAPFMLVKEAVPLIRKGGPGGNIVFMSSVAAIDPMPWLGVYSASKLGLIGLAKVLSKDLAPDGIRVNCIAPGLVETKFLTGIYKHVDEAIMKSIPMNRIAKPVEMGGIVAFLVSEDASYMTGEVVVAAGGRPCRL